MTQTARAAGLMAVPAVLRQATAVVAGALLVALGAQVSILLPGTPVPMTFQVPAVQLAIFNLVPIPVLDGGVILLLLIEGAMRRDLSLRVKERITQVGFAFLMLIAVMVIYNDIVKTLPERFERFLP